MLVDIQTEDLHNSEAVPKQEGLKFSYKIIPVKTFL